jgi:hypothetical protein
MNKTSLLVLLAFLSGTRNPPYVLAEVWGSGLREKGGVCLASSGL